MVKGNVKNFLIPNVTKVSDKNKEGSETNKLNKGQTSEFKEILGENLDPLKNPRDLKNLVNEKGIKSTLISPPFFGNMITAIYKKS